MSTAKTATTPAKAQPVHEIRLGTIKAAIWQNPTEAGPRYNVSFERIYKDGEVWKSTQSFGRDDLLLLAKMADKAHSWICDPEAADRSAKSGPPAKATASDELRLPATKRKEGA